jgi:hypothetical protein
MVYLAAALAYVIAVDTNVEGGHVGSWAFLWGHTEWLALLAIASLALGWAAGSWPVALLALALVPLGAPFDYPESRFSEPSPTIIYAGFLAPFSAGLILIGVGARKATGRYAGRPDASDT